MPSSVSFAEFADTYWARASLDALDRRVVELATKVSSRRIDEKARSNARRLLEAATAELAACRAAIDEGHASLAVSSALRASSAISEASFVVNLSRDWYAGVRSARARDPRAGGRGKAKKLRDELDALVSAAMKNPKYKALSTEKVLVRNLASDLLSPRTERSRKSARGKIRASLERIRGGVPPA